MKFGVLSLNEHIEFQLVFSLIAILGINNNIVDRNFNLNDPKFPPKVYVNRNFTTAFYIFPSPLNCNKIIFPTGTRKCISFHLCIYVLPDGFANTGSTRVIFVNRRLYLGFHNTCHLGYTLKLILFVNFIFKTTVF